MQNKSNYPHSHTDNVENNIGESLPFFQKNNSTFHLQMEELKKIIEALNGEILFHQTSTGVTYTLIIPNFRNGFYNNGFTYSNKKSPKEDFCFLQKIENILAENLQNDQFGIMELCKAIGISRSQLHNKIKQMTGVSTSIYIRSLRLEKAEYLLQTTDLNISEVAYSVGFRSASYFSKLFMEKYGIAPSRFRGALVH